MYGVTVDPEGTTQYGEGGKNVRAVFSVDVPDKTYTIPTNVNVGGDVETVQVANYYSLPIGPIQVTKHLTGGPWGDNMAFKFNIEGLGYTAYDSEHLNTIDAGAQPMPQRTTAEVTKADETNGVAIADFGSISFKYEGEYRYKITEYIPEEADSYHVDGVSYNVNNNEYYVKILVTKKDTHFSKDYTYSKLRNPVRSDGQTSGVIEEFHYLGADVIYYSDANFTQEVTKCSLYLHENIETGLISFSNNTFDKTFTEGTSIDDVSFTNTRSGNLSVEKKWLDINGNDDNDNHTELTLYIWQKTEGTNWTVYGSPIQLTKNSGWKTTVTGLPLTDENGKTYQYCVKESDDMLATYAVTYTYNGVSYNAADQQKITVDDKNVRDTGYAMSFDENTESFGTVKVSNMEIVTNVLPSTGGMGTTGYVAIGALLTAIAFAGMMLFRKRRAF
jgi:LPXTG-motif cell wall-anchored protein